MATEENLKLIESKGYKYLSVSRAREMCATGTPLKAKLFANKDYISQTLSEVLFLGWRHLITSIRTNMNKVPMELKDKIFLSKRSVIETINDELKNICQVEHSRHRSFDNFVTNLLAGLIAYSYCDKKHSIKYDPIESN